MTKDHDIELIKACQRGELDAPAKLIDQFQSPVFNAAYRIVGNLHDAEDVSQSVFLKVFENLDAYKPEFRLFSWIYRIAINESINFSKRKRHFREYNKDVYDQDQVQSNDQPDNALEAKTLGVRLELALRQISEDYRAVIVLKHIAGFSYQEISEILKVPEKTVRSRLYTARQQLQSLLGEQASEHF